MVANPSFRSAFNGFNREDVVHYIEYINTKHAEELNGLRSELEFLQEKLDAADPQLEQRLSDAEAARDGLQEQLTEAISAREALEALCAELEGERDAALSSPKPDISALEAKIEQLQKELDAARAAKAMNPCRMELELEAYRRAERTERIARERADQVYRATNAALAEATIRVDEAAATITETTEQVMQQLNQLHSAVCGSREALREAAATMYSIRPSATEE